MHFSYPVGYLSTTPSRRWPAATCYRVTKPHGIVGVEITHSSYISLLPLLPPSSVQPAAPALVDASPAHPRATSRSTRSRPTSTPSGSRAWRKACLSSTP